MKQGQIKTIKIAKYFFPNVKIPKENLGFYKVID